MVNSPKPQKRFAPADNPANFASFTDWIHSATEMRGLRGLQARLAEYCGGETGPQHVTKWRGGSIPEIPRLKQIAEWAQVDYEALRVLADKQREEKQSAPRSQRSEGKVAAKKKPARRAS